MTWIKVLLLIRSHGTRELLGIHFFHDYFLRYLLFVLFVS